MKSRFFLTVTCMLGILTGYAQPFHKIFDFASTEKKNHHIPISETIIYGQEGKTYGFDLNTEKHVQVKQEQGQQSLYSHKPFYFSVDVPEGNYTVTIHYKGMSDRDYHSTVRSESRRLHIEHVKIKYNKAVSKSFNVHIKDARIDSTKSVRLKKPRENRKLDWDHKLTLEFQGENNIAAIEIEAIEDVTTVFLAGNSTVVNQENEPWASWGQMFPRFFDTNVVIANHAESGLTLGSFLYQNRLEKILSVAKPGDYLFIEFGHNDQKEKGENAGAFKNYSERLRLFVQAFREKGGFPVIVTSTERRRFNEEGELRHTLGDYPKAAKAVAKELDVPLIDLNAMTRAFYLALGVVESKKALVHYPANTFPNQDQPLQDNTHFNTYGAYEIAKMVVQGVKDRKLPLRKHIIDFKKYNPHNPSSPSAWNWLPSVNNEVEKPDGN
ncbi:rhamnogalacturonan acetylesterase [Sphingobacterium arenae]|uniref:Rhamnogalacturonan acetylesterase n=1 Tax=Sphingobacterium arenae TaxID=1280598 RepID=A0ABR7Y9G6_9SPHI|nr:rhamnogalacturonan acetylesterase [Sphingobacterium arenae]MBD1427949.1 rhamnogalacturonan acetylesterase [Sphingobacterium arenae]